MNNVDRTCRVDKPLTKLAPHGTGRAACPHPALCKADTSLQSPYILT